METRLPAGLYSGVFYPLTTRTGFANARRVIFSRVELVDRVEYSVADVADFGDPAKAASGSVNPIQSAHPIAETLNRTDEKSIAGLRPNLSLSHPAAATPQIDPTRAHPTYQPFAIASSENLSATADIVPETTAVS